MRPSTKGFTLIELLVVISIIGLLSSIVLVSLATARIKAYDAQRLSNLTSVQTALEVYYAANGSYPISGGDYLSTCTSPSYGSTVSPSSAVIPGITPTYLATVPTDPQSNGVNTCCYYYKGTATDYKFKLYSCGTNTVACSGAIGAEPSFPDPVRANTCAVYSPNASSW